MMTTDHPSSGPKAAGVEDHPQVHESHLALAEQLQACATSMRTQLSHPEGPTHDEDDYLRGYMRALDDLASHLRVGDWLPGGLFGEAGLAATA